MRRHAHGLQPSRPTPRRSGAFRRALAALSVSAVTAAATGYAEPPPATSSVSTAASVEAPAPQPSPPAPQPSAPAPATTASATEPKEKGKDPAAEARAAFESATQLAKWGLFADALIEYQKSSKLRPHPKTTFLMAECERGLGHDTRARKLLREALHASPGLDEPEREEAAKILDRINKRLATLKVRISPPDAVVRVDDRPLELDHRGAAHSGADVWVAGTTPGNAEVGTRSEVFEILLDPGHHRILFSSAGFDDVTEERTLGAGESATIQVKLHRSIQRQIGMALGGLGVAGLAAGSAAAIFAAARLADSNSPGGCRGNRCTDVGLAAYRDAQQGADLATPLLAGSGVVTILGAVLWWAFKGTVDDTQPRSTTTAQQFAIGGGHDRIAISFSGGF